MQISCFLWLAILLVIFIFEKVTAWSLSRKELYKNQEDQYSNTYSEYNSLEDYNNNVGTRNEREADIFEAEDIANYDSDLYPSLNIFSWWSSKNKGRNPNNITLMKEIKNVDPVRVNNSITPATQQTADCTFPLFATTAFCVTTKVYENTLTAGKVNINNQTTVSHLFPNTIPNLNSKTTLSTANILKSNISSEINKPLVGVMVQDVHPSQNNSNDSVIKENSGLVDGFNDTSASLKVISHGFLATTTILNIYSEPKEISEGNILSQQPPPPPLPTTLSSMAPIPFITAPINITKNLENTNLFPGRKIDNTVEYFNATMKHTYRTTMAPFIGHVLGPMFYEDRSKFLHSLQNNNSISTMNYANYNLEDNNKTDNNLNVEIRKSNSKATASPLEMAMFNFTKKFHLFNSGRNIPYPLSLYNGTDSNTSSRISLFTTTPNPPSYTVDKFQEMVKFDYPSSSLNRPIDSDSFSSHLFPSTIQTDEDPFSFLQPIPILKFKSNNGTNTEGADGKLINSVSTENYIFDAMHLLEKVKNKNITQIKTNPEMRYIFPEYFSGFKDKILLFNSNNNRMKRTPNKLAEKDDGKKKLISRSCNYKNGLSTDIFLSKFINLQNDLSDLQKAIVTEAKNLSADSNINDKNNITMHVRVIVNMENDGLDRKFVNSTINGDIGLNNQKHSTHNITKRSWDIFPRQNQTQLLLDQITDEKPLEELQRNTVGNLENGDDPIKNDELNEKLNYLSSLLTINEDTLNKSNIDGSKFLLTAQIEPIENKIYNPINKAIYSKYIEGEKYLVIPVSYLEKQIRNEQNGKYNILQPTSVYLKTFENNKISNETKDLIANYINNVRRGKAKQKYDYNINDRKFTAIKPEENNLSIGTKLKISDGKRIVKTLLIGKPELIVEFSQNPIKAQTGYNTVNIAKTKLKPNKDFEITHNTNKQQIIDKYKLKNNYYKIDKVKCIKYPLYNIENSKLLNENNEILLKNRGAYNYRNTIKPFLYFTNSQIEKSDLPVEEEKLINEEIKCKSNLFKFMDCSNNETTVKKNVLNKKSKIDNLKTIKIDLKPFEYFHGDKDEKLNRFNELECFTSNCNLKTEITPEELQGSLLFASKLNNKRDAFKFQRIKRKFRNIVKSEITTKSVENYSVWGGRGKKILDFFKTQIPLAITGSKYAFKTTSKTKTGTNTTSTTVVSTVQSNKTIHTDRTTTLPIVHSLEECGACEDICTNVPPTVAGANNKNWTSNCNSNGDEMFSNISSTPSEEEIRAVCTECYGCVATRHLPMCEGEPSFEKNQTDHKFKPKGFHCHHHLKNHTSLDAHKMHSQIPNEESTTKKHDKTIKGKQEKLKKTQ